MCKGTGTSHTETSEGVPHGAVGCRRGAPQWQSTSPCGQCPRSTETGRPRCPLHRRSWVENALRSPCYVHAEERVRVARRPCTQGAQGDTQAPSRGRGRNGRASQSSPTVRSSWQGRSLTHTQRPPGLLQRKSRSATTKAHGTSGLAGFGRA